MAKLSNMPLRSIGDIQVPCLGFGCMSLTPGFLGEEVDQIEAEKTLRLALDSGIILLNTADFYTSQVTGETSMNLKFIGKVLKDYPRERAVIAMKVGPWVEGGFAPFDLSPDALKTRVDKALAALGTEYVDFLIWRKMPHSDVANTKPESIAETFKALVESGKARAVGVSNVTADDFRAIHEIVPIKVVEEEWSLCGRENEKEIFPLARQVGAGILAYSPMGSGSLTGKFDLSALEKTDVRTFLPHFQGAAMEHKQKMAQKLLEMSKDKNCTPGQLALAWVLAQGNDVVPIPGTKRTKYLKENLKALDISLSREEIEQLNSV